MEVTTPVGFEWREGSATCKVIKFDEELGQALIHVDTGWLNGQRQVWITRDEARQYPALSARWHKFDEQCDAEEERYLHHAARRIDKNLPLQRWYVNPSLPAAEERRDGPP